MEIKVGTRWLSSNKVFEKREWGWKFLGMVHSMVEAFEKPSNDVDHPEDIFNEEYNERGR